MVMLVKDDEWKGVIDTLLDDDESFIVKKRRKEESDISEVVRKVRETIKKRSIEEKKEEKPDHMRRLEEIKKRIETSAAEIKREEVVEKRVKERPYLSDVEVNVIRALVKYGPDVRRIARVTGYPDFVVTKAIERLMSKGYIDEDLNVSEKAAYLVSMEEKGRNLIARILDICIIVAGIILVISTLSYFGFIP